MSKTLTTAETSLESGSKTVLEILAVISVCHLLNDMMASLLPAIYPLLKDSFHLDFAQVGLITLTYQLTASLLQPLVGLHTDRHPQPYSLPAGMGFTLMGLILLALARSFTMVLAAAALVGTGSSVFHPESSRVARMASGGQHGLAQSLFQLGGNAGLALGPLLAAIVILPKGQSNVAWFSLAALLGMILLARVSYWAKAHMSNLRSSHERHHEPHAPVSRRKVAVSIAILLALLFSKYFYLASITSYYTFYLMSTFHVPVRSAQMYLFVFLGAVALGIIAGGPIGDRIGRKRVIWGFDFRGSSVHLDFALRQPVLDGHPQCGDWLDTFLGVSGDRGLWPGAHSWKGRHDFGTLLRLRIWHGGIGRRRTRRVGRFDQHSICVSGLLGSTGGGPVGRLLAQSGTLFDANHAAGGRYGIASSREK